MALLIDGIAACATVLIIGTYLLTATDRVSLLAFHWANFLGACGTLPSTILHHAYPSLVLTLAFGLIGMVGVLRWN